MRPIAKNLPEPNRVEELPTDHGLCRAGIYTVVRGVPRASLVLGHGGGAGPTADLIALAAQLPKYGIEVVLVDQPWRIEGRKMPDGKVKLDSAWTSMVTHLRRTGIGLRRLVVGGHSTGARVACRTVAATKAEGLLALAYPLINPRNREATDRIEELAAAAALVPVTVIQGTADKFGDPATVAARVAEEGQRVLTVALPMVDHGFNLKNKATITDAEARLVLVESARRAVLRSPGNTGPLLAR